MGGCCCARADSWVRIPLGCTRARRWPPSASGLRHVRAGRCQRRPRWPTERLASGRRCLTRASADHTVHVWNAVPSAGTLRCEADGAVARFLFLRLVQIVVVMFVVSTLLFFLMRSSG